MTFRFYLLDTFWQDFSKIDSLVGGGVAAVVFKMRRLEKLNIQIFSFCFKTMEMHRGVYICARKDVSGTKSDFSRVLLDSRGGKYRIAMTQSILERIFL